MSYSVWPVRKGGLTQKLVGSSSPPMILRAPLRVLVAIALGGERLRTVGTSEYFEAQVGAHVVLDIANLVELFAALEALEHAPVVAGLLIDAWVSDVVLCVVDFLPSEVFQLILGLSRFEI